MLFPRPIVHQLHVQWENLMFLLGFGSFVGFLEQGPLQNAVGHPLVVKLTHY